MVEWYVPLGSSLPSALEGEGTPMDDLPNEGEASNSELDKKKTKNSKQKGETDKGNKIGDKSKVGRGRGNDIEGSRKNADSSKEKDGLVQANLVGKKDKVGKGKETVQLDESNSNGGLNKAHKAVQVPEDLEEAPKEDFDTLVVPINWNNEPTVGTIVLRPLVGRKFELEQTPLEEWKWPQKIKRWGSIEMYMVERGAEDLDWVFWGKSDRICDTSYPLPQLGAKLKFLHPKDARIEIPRNGKDLGEELPQVKGDGSNELPKGDISKNRGGAEPKDEDGTKNKKQKIKEKSKS
ncbi:unnamed protein product [Calypogeia fissa]